MVSRCVELPQFIGGGPTVLVKNTFLDIDVGEVETTERKSARNSKTAPCSVLRRVSEDLAEDDVCSPRSSTESAASKSTESPRSAVSLCTDEDEKDPRSIAAPISISDSSGISPTTVMVTEACASYLKVVTPSTSASTEASTNPSPRSPWTPESPSAPLSPWASPAAFHATPTGVPGSCLAYLCVPVQVSTASPLSAPLGEDLLASSVPHNASCLQQPQISPEPSNSVATQRQGDRSVQLTRQRPRTVTCTYNQERDAFQISWTCDARKLRSQDRQIVSPSFGVQLGMNCPETTFRMMLVSSEFNSFEGGSSFCKSQGKGIVKLKCESSGLELPQVRFAISIGIGKRLKKQRGPVQHSFSDCAVAGLSNEEQEWDFHSVIDYVSKTFVVNLEITTCT